ncbi:MAG: SDR family oxidoreductase [Candidatus Lokiarchaeota archaeon]|nr:SDR family oxidoreductase [Candidatus Lokiarchaeota archaeon]
MHVNKIGKVAVVTAVSGGIGQAIFKDTAPGARAIVSSSRGAKENFWKGADWPANATHVTADMTLEPDVERLFASVIEQHGRVDVAINCVGGSMFSHKIEDFPADEFDQVIETNLRSAFLFTKHAIRAMKRNGSDGGNIVHVVSISAKKIAINKGPYGMAKAAVAKLIHYAAHEAADYNILINGISPGYVFTPRHEQEIDEKSKKTGKPRERIVDGLIQGQLIKQHLAPADLLDAVRLLATTRVMTGQVINVDLGEVLSY